MLNAIWEVLQEMGRVYAHVFDLNMWVTALSSVDGWVKIFMLVGLEGLLSADNALVLAVMVAVLPLAQRKKALFYGFAGAILFRFIFIGLGTYLISITWIKFVGAAYLAYLCIDHFIKYAKGESDEEDGEKEAVDVSTLNGFQRIKYSIQLFFANKWNRFALAIGAFWATVIKVELMDVAFSVDSILAALAISNEIWVLLLGGVLGILMMRAVAGVFLKLIDRIPEMVHTAYVLIGLISLKMAISHWYEVNHWVFFGVLIGTFLLTFVVHKINVARAARV